MEPDKKNPNAVVETYADAMAKVLENDREGLVKKIIHGAEEEEAAKKKLSPESKQDKFFLASGIFLVLLGASVAGYFLLITEPTTVPVERQFAPMIFIDKNSFLEISGLKKENIEQIILTQINASDLKQNAVEGIYPTISKQIIGLRQFLSLIKSNLILPESQEIVSDSFILGVVNVEKNTENVPRPGFFLLMKVKSVPDVFADMKTWERKMFLDLQGLLGIPVGSETTYLNTKDFADGLVGNKNARFLYDKDGNLVLMYLFADDTSVVVSNSKEAAREIMLRLGSKQTKE